MVSPEVLSSIPFFSDFPPDLTAAIAQVAEEKRYKANDFIVRQHDEARTVSFLLSGSVQFLIRFEGVDDLLVGTTRRAGTLIGWSAFRIPYRYTASVRCEEECRVVSVPKSAIDNLTRENPELGFRFLHRVAITLSERLEQTRDLLVVPRGTASAPTGVGLA